ncbi:MAG: DUF4296 domain-containing protein [Cytophagaceae bacterium]
MGLKKWITVIFIAFLGACGENSGIQDEELLSQEEMIDVLIRIHLAEGKVATKNLHPDSAKVVYSNYERQIFEELEIDKKVYNKSYQYYVSDPEKMDRIYSAVVDSLSLREARGLVQ